MRGVTVISLLTVVCYALASHLPMDEIVIQVKQEVTRGRSCGGGCRSHRVCQEKKCYEGENGLKLWVTPAGSYEDAVQDCHEHGYHLVAIKDAFLWADVIDTLRDNIKGLHDFWVDGSYDGEEWVFSDGTMMPLGSPFWDMAFDRPTCDDNMTCVAMQGNRGYYWTNTFCDFSKHGLCVCDEVPAHYIPGLLHDCPENSTWLYDRCVMVLPYLPIDYQGAIDGCADAGGILLKINNPGILRSFANYVNSTGASISLYINGIRDSDGIFYFTHDMPVPMGSPYFDVGYPANIGDFLTFSVDTCLVRDHSDGQCAVACQVPSLS